MNFNGVGFNVEWVATRTEKQFVEEFSKYAHIYPGDPDREKKLREVHKTCVVVQKKKDAVVFNNS